MLADTRPSPAASGTGSLAATSSEGVVLAQAVAHAPRDGHQQYVALIVAVGVVDRLEAVEVHIHHGNLLLVPAGARHGLLQAIRQHRAVGQAGQRVVVGNVLELVLVCLQLRDVGQDGHVVRDLTGGVAHHVHVQCGDVALAGRALAAQFAFPHAVPVEVFAQRRERLVLLVGNPQVTGGGAYQVVAGGVADDLQKRVVDGQDAAVRVGDQHALAGVGEHAGGDIEPPRGLPPGGDVAYLDGEALRVGAADDQAGRHRKPAFTAIDRQRELHPLNPAVPAGFTQRLHHRVHHRRGQGVVDPVADQLLGPDGRGAGVRRPAAQDAAVGVALEHRFGCCRQHGLQFGGEAGVRRLGLDQAPVARGQQYQQAGQHGGADGAHDDKGPVLGPEIAPGQRGRRVVRRQAQGSRQRFHG
jgi:hypothetical protein